MVCKPEWYIEAWLCQPGKPSGCSFSIVTTTAFDEMEMRAIAKADIQGLQDRAREIARKAGKDFPIDLLILDGQQRLRQINIPSAQSGCWLARDRRSSAHGHWEGHNIDTTLEQSILFAIWQLWADMVGALS